MQRCVAAWFGIIPASLKLRILSSCEGLALKLKIVVAEDNQEVLHMVTSILATEFDVVATATDGKSAVEIIHLYRPHVAVLDLGMPQLNGIEVTRELAKYPWAPAIVICSIETDATIVEAAREAGAVGYVFKTRIDRELIEAVKSAARGRPAVSQV
jgi:DNA-binding NarL/FixJ family response regulator